jgi:uncharacterized membrane protein YkvA (DUF1232 family)
VSRCFRTARCHPRCMKIRSSTVQTVLLAIAALVYDLWPVDVIPDFVPGPGQVDDAVVTLFAAGIIIFRFFRSRALR